MASNKGGSHEDSLSVRSCPCRFASPAPHLRMAQDKPVLAFVVNGAVGLLEDRRSRREEGAGRAARLRPAVQISRAGRRRHPAAPDGRPRRRRRRRHHGERRRSEDLDRGARTASAARCRSSPPTATRPNSNRIAYIGSLQHRARQGGRRARCRRRCRTAASASASSACPAPTTPASASRASRQPIDGSKVELIDVRGDDIDQTRAKRNVEDVLAANPDINCMVGFYSYNPPRIYEVLKEAGKLGQIKVIALRRRPDHARRRARRHDRRHRRAASPMSGAIRA